MPAVAVGAAVWAGGSIAAAGGIAAFAASAGVWAAVGAVGAIASGIGTVTGNQKLTTIGAIAGLAGGIGTIAQNQGWFTASELATSSPVGTAAAEGAAAEAAGSAAASAPSVGVTDPSAGLVNSGTAAETALSPLQAADVGSAGGVTPVSTGGSYAADAFGTTAGFGGENAALLVRGSDSLSVMDKMSEFGKVLYKNKELASLGLNFVGGMFDDKKDAETELLKTQNRLLEQRAGNANSVPSLNSLKVSDKNVFKTTQPTYLGPRVGLINT